MGTPGVDHSKGQPRNNGEYAERPRTPPGQISGLVLTEDIDSGTFNYPVEPTDSQTLLTFWSKVEIPESVVDDVYRRSVKKYNEVYDEFSAVYPDPEPRKDEFGSPEEYTAAYSKWVEKKHRLVEYNEKIGNIPIQPTRRNIRSIIRAACIYRESYNMPDQNEAEQVRTMTVELPGGRETTPEKLWNTYDFDSAQELLVEDKTNRIESTLERIARGMDKNTDHLEFNSDEIQRKREIDEILAQEYENRQYGITN